MAEAQTPNGAAAPLEQTEKKAVEETLLFKGEDPSDPLAIRLLNAVVNLLFYPNFTVSPLTQVPAQIETFPLEQVWEPGVGVQDVRLVLFYFIYFISIFTSR